MNLGRIYKKIIFYAARIICAGAIVLSSCADGGGGSGSDADADAVAADKTNLEIGFVDGDSAIKVTGNLALQAAGPNGTSITWESDNINVIKNNGIVKRPKPGSGNAEINITATISKGQATSNRFFILSVIEAPGTDTEAVKEDKRVLEPGFAQGDDYSAVTQNIVLYKEGPCGSVITWSSGNPETITAEGKVNLLPHGAGNAEVVLNASLKKNSAVAAKSFVLTVIESPGNDADSVAADKQLLSIGFSSGDSLSNVTQNILLKSKGVCGSEISWSSNKPGIISSGGNVTRPAKAASDAFVELTASLSKGSASDIKIFNLTVKKMPYLDIEAVDMDRNSLEIGYIAGDSAGSVTGNIALPLKGKSGSAISWMSGNNSIMSISGSRGIVTRPLPGSGNADVTLTASLVKGTANAVKDFLLTTVECPLSDNEAVEQDANSLFIIFTGSDDESNVTSDLMFDLSGPCGTVITWSSGDEDVISNDGRVTRPPLNWGDAKVTLTAEIRKNTATAIKTFYLIVKKIQEELDDHAYTYIISPDGFSVRILKMAGTASEAEIPSEISGLPVRNINFSVYGSSALLSQCASLKKIILPASVEEIGPLGGPSLSMIEVDSNNGAFSSVNGVLYNKSGTELIECPAGSANGSFTVPSNVISIRNYAFDSCAQLTSFNVSSGSGAFSSIDGALYNKTGTALIRVPAAKTGGFSVQSGVKSINESAFRKMGEMYSMITNLFIPSSVETIDNGIFTYCPNLADITVAGGNGFFSSIDGVLFDKAGNKLIRYPPAKTGAYAVPPAVTSIGNSAFQGCKGLTGITINANVTSIGQSAFSGCTELAGVSFNAGVASINYGMFTGCKKLTGIVLPAGITEIDSFAFQDCDGLKSVILPSGLVTIGSNAFSGCVSLESISIPQSVKTISWDAFSKCASLASVFIPSGVTSVYPRVFAECTKLTTITVDGSNANYSSSDGILFNKAGTRLVIFPAGRSGTYAISGGVTAIHEYAFAGCTLLTNVTIPPGVVSIQRGAFSGCRNLVSAALPSGITSIADSLFSECSSLADVIIPSTVTNIEARAFSMCVSLESVSIPGGVGAIGSGAFSGAGLLGITLPGSVTSVGSSAFSQCKKLAGVVIPNISDLKSGIFSGCISLESIIIPGSIITIQENAFAGCVRLAEITVNAGTPPSLDVNSLVNVTDSALGSITVPASSVDAYRSAPGWSVYDDIISGE